MNYRTTQVDNMVAEIESESKVNQEKVSTTMAALRQLINEQEQVLLEQIKNTEKNEKKTIEEYKRNLQGEQQGLIEQIFNVIAIRRDRQPRKLLEAKQTFQEYITNMDARLVQLKPWTRKKQQVLGIDEIDKLKKAVEDVKVAEVPKHVNDKLTQLINNNTDKSKLSLVNLELKDMDMEIVANEMAINKVISKRKTKFLFIYFYYTYIGTENIGTV